MKRKRNCQNSPASSSPALSAVFSATTAALGLLTAGGGRGGGFGPNVCWAFDVRSSVSRPHASTTTGRKLPAASLDSVAPAPLELPPPAVDVTRDTRSVALPKELLVPSPAEFSTHARSSSSLLLHSLQQDIWPVLSASLLVTGNTVGAGCLVLPELAAGPGLAASSAVFGASYLLNLLSGLTIARIAVEQHEQKQNPAEGKGADPQSYTTSSFQDLARSTLGNGAGALVSSVSLLVNAAVLCFDMGQVGREVGERLLVSDAGVVVGPVASAAFAGTIATLLANLPTHRVSDVASVCVAVLFASFGGLLLSSSAALASAGVDTTVSASSLDLQGLMASAFFAPGASSSIDAAASGLWGSLGQAAPVIFMSMVYQNIVPSVVKMLDYNMNRVTSALSLGSFLPLCLYLVWCVVGSGASSSLTDTAGPLLALFTASTLVGSALGTGMSLVEEVQALHSSGSAVEVVESEENDGSTVESCPSSPPPHWGSVAISFGLPLVTALALGEDRVVEALEWAGSFGSPLLYGVLPAAMAFRQRQQRNAPRNQGHEASVQWHELFRSGRQQHPFVYSLPSLGVLGVISTGFIGEELVQQVSSLAS